MQIKDKKQFATLFVSCLLKNTTTVYMTVLLEHLLEPCIKTTLSLLRLYRTYAFWLEIIPLCGHNIM